MVYTMANKKRLTTQQKLFLDALISEEAMGDLRAAMRIAGYSDKTKVAHTARELRTEIKEAAETLLAIYAPKAAYSLTKLLDNPDTFNARNIISASKEILDRTGLGVKAQKEIDYNNEGAIIILPPKTGLV
jgi:hypothetical protein